MTKKETAQLVAVIKKVFPNSYKDLTQKDWFDLVDTWYWLLAEYDINTATIALKTWLSSNTSAFPPTPGMILDVIAKLQSATGDNSMIMSESEAWESIYKAICNSSYHSKEEYEKLPQILQKVVGSPQALQSWGRMEIETVQSVVQSNCMRSFRSIQKNDFEQSKMPKEIRNLIEKASTTKSIGLNKHST